jgi:hypothetical protein
VLDHRPGLRLVAEQMQIVQADQHARPAHGLRDQVELLVAGKRLPHVPRAADGPGLVVTVPDQEPREQPDNGLGRRGYAGGQGDPAHRAARRPFPGRRGGQAGLAHPWHAGYHHPAFGGQKLAQFRKRGRALHVMAGQRRDGSQVDGIPGGRRGGGGGPFRQVAGHRAVTRAQREFVQAGGELGLGPEPQGGQEQRGHDRGIGPPPALLQPADLRLAVPDRDAKLALRQPDPVPQDPQQRAEVSE